MNKVEKVSIDGYAFTLEENAYNVLNSYLEELSQFYSKKEDGSEILEAFEERIAEILMENNSVREVKNLEDVNKVISVLGCPAGEDTEQADENFANNQREGSQGDKKNEWWKVKGKGQLMRDPEHRVLGGVLSGIAAYFKMDSVLVRLIYVAILVFSLILANHDFMEGLLPISVLAYIVLWIIIPAPSNEKELRSLREGVDEISQSSFARSLVKVARVALGVIFSIIGITSVVTLMLMIFSWTGLSEATSYWAFANVSDSDGFAVFMLTISGILATIAGRVCMILLFALPAVGFLWEGIKMVFDIKTKIRLGLIFAFVWFAALCTVIGLGMHSIIPVL